MGVFTGQYERSLDQKGRVALPAGFKDDLRAGVYVAKGLDGCLEVWPVAAFEAMVEDQEARMNRGEISRQAFRTRTGAAFAAVPDGQNRVPLNDKLRRFAEITGTSVVVVGAGSKLEIWDEARWNALEAQGDDELKRG
jgi:MraZ protein